jgi:hypothetical protein
VSSFQLHFRIVKIFYLGVIQLPNPTLPGCFVAGRSSIQFVEWALVMGFEGGLSFDTSVVLQQTG